MANEQMGTFTRNGARAGIGQSFGQLADGLGRLVSEHLTLARLELTEDARAVGVQVAQIALVVPFILIGYALLCVSGALYLSRYVSSELAFAIVGGLNGVGGGLALWRAVRRIQTRAVLSGTFDELRSTTSDLFGAQPEAPRLENGNGR